MRTFKDTGDIRDIRMALEAYFPKFRQEVESLFEKIASHRLEPGRIIGVGQNAVVYKIIVEGKAYAVRVPKDGNTFVLNKYITNLASAMYCQGVERIVACSNRATVSEFVEGKTLEQMSPIEIFNIPRQHVLELLGTLDRMSSSNLTVDNTLGNFLYHPSTGFTIIEPEIFDPTRGVGEAANQDLGIVFGELVLAFEFMPNLTNGAHHELLKVRSYKDFMAKVVDLVGEHWPEVSMDTKLDRTLNAMDTTFALVIEALHAEMGN